MNQFNEEIATLLKTELFQQIVKSDAIQIAQLNAAISLLIKMAIPFNVEFSPGTRRIAAAAELTIYLNPTTKLNFVLSFQAGSGVFGGGIGI